MTANLSEPTAPLLSAAAAAGVAYTLAVLDLQLPTMDGLQLARTIKAHAILAGVRLVLVPPLGQRGAGEAARAADIQGYLTKPVRQAQLHDCLLALLVLREMGAGQLITRHTLTNPALSLELPDPLDRERVETVRKLLEEALAETIAVFLQHTSTQLAALHEAIA